MRVRFICSAILVVVAMRIAPVQAQEGAPKPFFDNWRMETWFQFRNNSESSDYSKQNKLTVRLFQPFELGHGWILTMGEDIPYIVTDQTDEDNKNGLWLAAP